MIVSRLGYWLALAAIIFGLFLLAMARSAQVQAQVRVPQECIDLAMKYGRPLAATMSRYRAAQVKAELKLLSDDDPAVRKCRDAVARLEK